ncbi:MAG: ABC transporter ATP-binding protein [Leptotrichiaceae bacterium]|nr:ABC transporter ATP-binding protein [Leptotrichiaceae bacterium]
MKEIVKMTDIIKTFGEVQAIKNGNFNLFEGEIHSLIGENGAGKSTMMKLLYGIYSIDSGSIEIYGKKLENYTPKDAINLGIGMVHQEFMLVNEMTVLENIILGFEPVESMVMINFSEARAKVLEYVEKYNLNIQINKKVKDISVGEAQRVEIIKTLYRGANILILDEPTAVLTPQETEKLFEILENLKQAGKSIIFISHKLNEVMEISDRITVMRDSKYIETVDKKNTSPLELAKMMVGREVLLNVKKKKIDVQETILEVKDIYVPSDRELSKIKGLSFSLKRGEILGIAGVDGNGQKELVEAITGLRETEKGEIIFKDKNITNRLPKLIRKAGIAHIPDDRNVRGLNREMSIKENIIATKFSQNEFSGVVNLKEKNIVDFSEEMIKKFDIRPADYKIITKNLSGGNAQKIIVARELESDTDLLIASQPTRGIDIGSIETIRKNIVEYRDKNKGVLLVSAELEEILTLSDRILVMYEGKIVGNLEAKDATEENVGFLMTGGKEKNAV